MGNGIPLGGLMRTCEPKTKTFEVSKRGFQQDQGGFTPLNFDASDHRLVEAIISTIL